ncbi:MAG: exosortase C-terminal domain/associated protein EpsI, partial [Myxococcota bacterium]
MSVKLRLSAVAIALLLPGLVLASWLRATGGPIGPLPPPELPRQVGPWIATADDEFGPRTVARLGVDAYLLRRYEAPARSPIWLYVGLYAAFRGLGGKYHDPEDCYPAQGWEIVDYRAFEVGLEGSGTLHSQVMQAQRGPQREVVLYWFQPAGRWPAVRAA